MVIVVLLCGALAEELMFRGYPFQHLEKAIGAVGAIVVFSVLYGVLHLLNPGAGRWGVVNTILIGILLSIAYLRTRSLWLPWGIHFGWNATLGLSLACRSAVFASSTSTPAPTATGPWWVTGGQLRSGSRRRSGTVAILLGILIVWLLPLSKLPAAGRRARAEPALARQPLRHQTLPCSSPE